MSDTDAILTRKKVSALLDGAKMGRLSKMILGWNGQIIDLATTADTLSIRCHGADDLSAKIEAARQA